MSNKHLRCQPHAIRGTKTAWWYEEPEGLTFVIENVASEGTKQITIHWNYIRAALSRKDRP